MFHGREIFPDLTTRESGRAPGLGRPATDRLGRRGDGRSIRPSQAQFTPRKKGGVLSGSSGGSPSRAAPDPPEGALDGRAVEDTSSVILQIEAIERIKAQASPSCSWAIPGIRLAQQALTRSCARAPSSPRSCGPPPRYMRGIVSGRPKPHLLRWRAALPSTYQRVRPAAPPPPHLTSERLGFLSVLLNYLGPERCI
jgi:hypothetical protein